MAVLIATQALFVATDAVQIAVQNAGDGAAAPGHQTFQQEHQQVGAMQQSCRLPKVSSNSGRARSLPDAVRIDKNFKFFVNAAFKGLGTS